MRATDCRLHVIWTRLAKGPLTYRETCVSATAFVGGKKALGTTSLGPMDLFLWPFLAGRHDLESCRSIRSKAMILLKFIDQQQTTDDPKPADILRPHRCELRRLTKS